MERFLLKLLLKQRFLAVYHDFYWFLQSAKFHSLCVKETEIYLRLRNPDKNTWGFFPIPASLPSPPLRKIHAEKSVGLRWTSARIKVDWHALNRIDYYAVQRFRFHAWLLLLVSLCALRFTLFIVRFIITRFALPGMLLSMCILMDHTLFTCSHSLCIVNASSNLAAVSIASKLFGWLKRVTSRWMCNFHCNFTTRQRENSK